MSYGDRDEGKIDGQEPHALPNGRRRRCGGSVDVEFCGGGPWPSVSGFRKGDDTHIPSAEGRKDRRLETGVIKPGPNGYCRVGSAIGTA